MQEELGDLLLQIAFQARVAEEHPSEPFDIDDVAGGLVDKLVRRHPHVFADVDAQTPDAVEANWETIKAAEKQHRTHPLEGVPVSLPALARAEKYIGRLDADRPRGPRSTLAESRRWPRRASCSRSSGGPGPQASTPRQPCARRCAQLAAASESHGEPTPTAALAASDS